MKILQQGQLPQEKLYRATCRNCGTMFEFHRAEARASHDPREGTTLNINCPLPGCNYMVWVNV